MMTICLCGCGKTIAIRTDGRPLEYIRGHNGAWKRIDYHCDRCDKVIKVHAWRIEKFGKAFCSRECFALDRMSLKEFICDYCGGAFTIKPSKKQGARVFCKIECFYAAYRDQPDSKVPVCCSQCGTEILIYPSKHKRQKRFYCGRQCRALFIKGSNNPAFTGGLGRRRKYGPHWKATRNAILMRDANTCQHCHKTPKIRRHLHVHHITPYYVFAGDWQSANQPSNLVTLCLKCHKSAEKGKIPVQRSLI